MRFRPSLVLAAIAIAGCNTPPTIGGPCDTFGSSQSGFACSQQFYFPAGIAIDPTGDTLYVTNANADLRYSSGTIQAIDVGAFDCAFDFTRAGAPQTGAVPASCAPARLHLLVCALRFAAPANGFKNTPEGCDGTDDKNFLAAVFTGDNRSRIGGAGLCRPDLLDPTILECDEQLLIAGALSPPSAAGTASALNVATVAIGNFGGGLRVKLPIGTPPTSPGGAWSCSRGTPVPGAGGVTLCDDGSRRIFAAVRGDPSITWVQVSHPSGTPAQLNCTPAGATPTKKGTLDSCDQQRITVRDFNATMPLAPGDQCNSDNINDPTKCVPIPAEPFGLAIDQGACGAGDCTHDTGVYERLLVAHLLTGEVTLINAAAAVPTSLPMDKGVAPNAEAVVLDVRSGIFNPDVAGRRGAYALAPRTPGQARGYWYVTSRTQPSVGVFRIADVNLVQPFVTFGLNNRFFNSGDDVRDLAFDPCVPGDEGCRAFVIENHPASLFTLDTRIDPRQVPAGVPINTVVDIEAVCQEPSHLAFRGFADWEGIGRMPLNRVYVLCYGSNQMAIVDPDVAQVVDITLVGRGPNEMAVNFGPGIARPADPSAFRPRAYATSFLDNSISVIDLEPATRTQNRVVGRIGFSEPPRLQ
jgi:hypothetical protein